ncbi:hypothetical protein FQN49_008676 [Arthroderma sp. PD_2]|nr:hypothetical protein FQN49_008676 [Arthroderma sp. PD_2]
MVYNFCYLAATLVGVGVAHSVSPEAGAGVGFGLYIAGAVVSVLIARTPDTPAPRFWGSNVWANRFWWLALYSGNQLMRDLNIVVAKGKNWNIPVFWGPVLRYISAPILAIIISFAYPSFYLKRNDPLQIFAFAIAHIIPLIVIVGVIVPRAFNLLLPNADRELGKRLYAPGVTMELLPSPGNVEEGSETGAAEVHEGKARKREVGEKAGQEERV